MGLGTRTGAADANTIEEFRRSLIERVGVMEWRDNKAVAVAQAVAQELFRTDDETFIALFFKRERSGFEEYILDTVRLATEELLVGVVTEPLS